MAIEPVFPSVKIVSSKIIVDKGQAGNEMDTKLLRALIGKSLAFAKDDEIEIPVKEIDPSLTDEEAEKFKQNAEKFIGKSITATFEFDSFRLADSDIVKVLDAREGYSQEELNNQVFKIASAINREPQDPKFNFENGRVTEFLPAKDGIELDGEKFKEILIQSLDKDLKPFDVPVKRTPPETTTEKVNNLGIKELIGKGTSKFRGSIPSRVHNIEVASSRLNGILIKPGETFSFNNALGDVSKFTGYQEAYVIREGKTILGDGGGV